jgi:predicted lipoprotein with Yx(FWY)xxD motif
MFGADKGSASSCTGACAVAWPPVTGNPHAGGAAKSADLGTIKRADGKTQVTYKGHPLYTFKKDGDAGDAYGQKNVAFGAPWHVLTPAGAMVG